MRLTVDPGRNLLIKVIASAFIYESIYLGFEAASPVYDFSVSGVAPTRSRKGK
jgi:hypothetical protein